VNADDAAYCFGCGDMGPLGEEIRRKAAQRPGEQLVWLLAVAIILIWSLALLVPKVIETGQASQQPPATTGPAAPYPVTQAPTPDSDAFVHVLLILVTVVVGLLALVYLIWLGIWISKRRREHKALVDTED
jgi:hypothetical protein